MRVHCGPQYSSPPQGLGDMYKGKGAARWNAPETLHHHTGRSCLERGLGFARNDMISL